jgi:hypothetical protein
MVMFPNLHDFYEDWRNDLESKGVKIRLRTGVTEILQRNDGGIVLTTRDLVAEANDRKGKYTGPATKTEKFDELVMCVLADDALKLLGKTASFRERFVLGGAKFFDDISITHSDSKYFQKHYETKFDPSLCAEPKSKTQSNQIAFSKGLQRGPNDEPSGYRPLYYTKSYAQDPQKIEMSFDCTNYQHQFRMDHDAEVAPVEYQNHVFQSIFLDKRNRDVWTMDEIDEEVVASARSPMAALC